MASAAQPDPRQDRHQASNCDHTRCSCCGTPVIPGMEPVIKRGAVVVAFDPLIVTWRGKFVPLSPTEAHVFAHICRRGRTTLQEIDRVMAEIGSNPANRSLVLGYIRGKFQRMGACQPFERLGANILRLRVDPDQDGAVAPVVGLNLPRYVTAA